VANEPTAVGRNEIKNWEVKVFGPGKEERGDHHNCLCPYCGKNNSYVTDGVQVMPFEIQTFEKPCSYCGEIIFYRAEYAIIVKAKAFVASKPLSEDVSKEEDKTT